MGYSTAKSWIRSQVAKLRTKGITDKYILELIELEKNLTALKSLLRGEVTDLSEEEFHALQRLFGAFLGPETPVTEKVVPQGGLSAALAHLKNPRDERESQKELYRLGFEPEEISSDLKAKTATIDDAARYYLSDVHIPTADPSRRTLITGKIGEQTVFANHEPNERFIHAHFKPDITGNDGAIKVYINVPFEKLKRELPGLLRQAKAGGAGSLKFNAVSNGSWADKIVVYFQEPAQAFAFATEAADFCEKTEITNTPVPFTFRVGNQERSPVAIGVDPPRDPIEGRRSWRGMVTSSLARAAWLFHDSPKKDELTRRLLKFTGIDTEFWLPTSFVETHRLKLREMRGGRLNAP